MAPGAGFEPARAIRPTDSQRVQAISRPAPYLARRPRQRTRGILGLRALPIAGFYLYYVTATRDKSTFPLRLIGRGHALSVTAFKHCDCGVQINPQNANVLNALAAVEKQGSPRRHNRLINCGRIHPLCVAPHVQLYGQSTTLPLH